MGNARTRLAALITPMLPEDFRANVKPYTVRAIGTLSAPTVFIDYTRITHDGMPQGAMLDGFDIALVSPLTDFAKAEDYLDPAVREFVRAIDPAPDLAWSETNKRELAEYLAWVVTVSFPTASHQE